MSLTEAGDYRRLGRAVEQVELHRLDLSDLNAVNELVATVRPEVLYHLGAVLTGPGEANPQSAIEANAIGTYALLEAARSNGVRQVIFASSIGTYGDELSSPIIDDATIQRPVTIYGVTKVFGEHLGAFYRRKYGLDFRGLCYPSIVGPGVSTPSVVQYTSWMIEESIAGRPFTVTVNPDLAVPIMYYKDAARAAIDLGRAPSKSIRTVSYLVDGTKPTPTAMQLAERVRTHIDTADIRFEVDPDLQTLLDAIIRPIDDSRARREWGWSPGFDLDAMILDFTREMRT